MEKNVLQLSFTSNKKDFKTKAYEYVCALLNSNGGTLILNTQMTADQIIRPIEQNFEDIIAISGVHKNLRISSKTANQITLEVQGHDELCTMNYNLYLPTDTQVLLVRHDDLRAVKEILNTKIVDITEISNTNLPSQFIFDYPIGIKESKTVQFKKLNSGKSGSADLAKRLINNKLNHYVSAFANHCGGRLYCGVRDDGIVEGQVVTEKEKENLVQKVSEYINKMIWPEHCDPAQRGREWKISFEPVTDEEGNPIESTFVIVIFVAACQGGVFCDEPESYHIVDGEAKKMTFDEWKTKLLNPTQRETKIVPRMPRCAWSSKSFLSLEGKLLRIINDGNWEKFMGLYNMKMQNTDNVEVRLVYLSKRLMYHYTQGNYREAEYFLAEYDNLLPKSNNVLIFDVRGRLVRSAMERSRGNHKKSYEIARDCLPMVQQLAPSILTVEFYVHFGTILTIIENNKDLKDSLKENLKTRGTSKDDEAILFYNTALQHLQQPVVCVSQSSNVDMQQKTLINLAFFNLDCSLSGDVVDHVVSEENIKRAEAYLKQACDLDISIPMSRFRKCHFGLAQSCCSYRKSQVEPTTEKRIDFLEFAIRETVDVEALASIHHFDELSRYARQHAQVFKKELQKLKVDLQL